MIDRTKFRRLHYLSTAMDLSVPEQRQRAFLIGAVNYFRSSARLKDENSLPGYMLGLHAIELGLKAYLLSKGDDFGTIKRNYRHCLTDLYDESSRRGLTLNTDNAGDLIAWFDELHSKYPNSDVIAPMRYEFIDVPALPHIDYVLSVAKEIIEIQQGWS